MGPLSSSNGFTYLLTMIELMTPWPEVALLAPLLLNPVFLFYWVARFCVPSVLASNRGTLFTSSVWAGVCHSLGISLSTTTSFHPQSNSMIKRFHRSFKTVLRACLAGFCWLLHLLLVLLGSWSVPKEGTMFSVSKAVFGSLLTGPGEFLEGGVRFHLLGSYRRSTCCLQIHHSSASPRSPKSAVTVVYSTLFRSLLSLNIFYF